MSLASIACEVRPLKNVSEYRTTIDLPAPLVPETFCIAHFAGPTEVTALEGTTIPSRKAGYGNGSAGSSRAGAPKSKSQGTYSTCQLACKYQWGWSWPPHPSAPNFKGGVVVLREGARPSVIRWSWWTCNTTLCLRWWLFLEVHLASHWWSHWRPRFTPDVGCRLCGVCTFSLWPHGFPPTFQIPGYLCFSTTINVPLWVCRI